MATSQKCIREGMQQIIGTRRLQACDKLGNKKCSVGTLGLGPIMDLVKEETNSFDWISFTCL